MKPEVGKVRAEDIAAFLAKFDDVEEAIVAIRGFAQPAVSAGLVDLPPTAKSNSAAKVMTPSAAAPERSGRCHIAITHGLSFELIFCFAHNIKYKFWVKNFTH